MEAVIIDSIKPSLLKLQLRTDVLTSTLCASIALEIVVKPVPANITVFPYEANTLRRVSRVCVEILSGPKRRDKSITLNIYHVRE